MFAVTGNTWEVLRKSHPELVPKIVTRGAVFARMSPDQKQDLIQELQALGYFVGEFFCCIKPLGYGFIRDSCCGGFKGG